MKQMKWSLILVASMSTKCYPCPTPCLGKSALCIQPSYWDHTMLHVSPIQRLFSFSFSDSRYTQYDPVLQSFQSYFIMEGHQNATASHSNIQYADSLSKHMIKRKIIFSVLLVPTLTNITLDSSLCQSDPLTEARSVDSHYLCGHGITVPSVPTLRIMTISQSNIKQVTIIYERYFKLMALYNFISIFYNMMEYQCCAIMNCTLHLYDLMGNSTVTLYFSAH